MVGSDNIEEWIKRKKEECESDNLFFPWKIFGSIEDHLSLNVKFDDFCNKFDLHLNRIRKKYNSVPEHGCVIPKENAKELSEWLSRQIIPKFAYKPGTSENIRNFGNSKFELIHRIKNAKNPNAFIELSYMINDYGNKFFLENYHPSYRRKKGVEIPQQEIANIITEIREFCRYWGFVD